MFSFLITLSIFMYLFWLRWVFVLRVSFSLGMQRRLLISVASPVAEHGLWVHGLQQLQLMSSGIAALGSRARAGGLRGLRSVGSVVARALKCGSVVVAPGLSCPQFEPVPPADGFFTTELPGKLGFINYKMMLYIVKNEKAKL